LLVHVTLVSSCQYKGTGQRYRLASEKKQQDLQVLVT
jgi:hypothetical protein